MTNPTTPLPVQEPAGAVEAKPMQGLAAWLRYMARQAIDQDTLNTWANEVDAALASLQPVTQAKSEAVALEMAHSIIQRRGRERDASRGVLIEFDRKLAEVWGKTDQPYAEAYGWVRRAWQAAVAAPSELARCTNCDDTGQVTSITGDWHGRCHCEAGRTASPLFATAGVCPQTICTADATRPAASMQKVYKDRGPWVDVDRVTYESAARYPDRCEVRALVPQEAVERQPLTDDEMRKGHQYGCDWEAFVRGVRFAERHHGIGPATQEKQHG